jgi:hypothetical protein
MCPHEPDSPGGLSHPVHGERIGLNGAERDMRFLGLIERDPARLTRPKHADFAGLGDAESIDWLI